jgi:hypothetical protein
MVHSRHLRSLTADDGAPPRLTGLGEALEELLEDLGLELFRPDVIEEEERARTDDGNVVDTVVDEILPHCVVAAGHECELQFRANAVRRGDEDRVAHAAKIRTEKTAETADPGKHFGTVRALYHRLNTAFNPVAEIHIHTGGSVGFF